MTRSSNGVWIALISLFGLTAMCGGAAPPATQPGAALLETENRALRSKLMGLNNRNLNLEIEIAKLKAQVKALEEQLSPPRRAVPIPPQPFQFQAPAPTTPYPTPTKPIPKDWVPKKYGNLDYYVIPLKDLPD